MPPRLIALTKHFPRSLHGIAHPRDTGKESVPASKRADRRESTALYEEIVDDTALHIRQSKITAGVPKCKPLMVQAQEVQ